jgi:hypothetical protein
MNRNDIQALLRERGEYEQIRSRLQTADPAELFYALFPLAVSRQWDEPAAYFAARLLYDLRPPCLLSCDAAIQATFATWDVSIEEVPWYLVTQFGKAVIEHTIQQLLSITPGRQDRQTLETIRYWVGHYR